MDAKGMNRYQGFGLENEWISYFLEGDDWLVEGKPLGNRKIMAMKNWLKDAELWDKSTTELGRKFRDLANPDDRFMWAVIWYNLAENAPLIKWYCSHVPSGTYTKLQLISLLSEFRDQSEPNRTDKNAIDSLINILTKSPIGKTLNQGIEVPAEKGSERRFFKSTAKELIDEALLYSIIRYSEKVGRRQMVASELVNSQDTSPAKAFGLDYETTKNMLIRIAHEHPSIIRIEFAGNLDNIVISNGTSSMDIIEDYVNNNPKR